MLSLGLYIPRASGVSSTAIVAFLGTGASGNTGDGGAATAATLGAPTGVAVAGDGTVYVADATYHVIRKVDPAGVVTRIAGTGVAGFSGDGGPATAATLNTPAGIALAADGALLIADLANDRIRKVAPNGTITTIAGTGGTGPANDGKQALQTRIEGPVDVALGAAGTLLLTERDRHRVRRIGADGIVSTVAGNGTAGYSGDGGTATSAMLSRPHGVALAADGSVYIADRDNDAIRRVAPNGVITTVAGTGVGGPGGDGGPATSAQLAGPHDVAADPNGTLLIADTYNRRIRRVSAAGTISTVVGTGANGNSGDGGPPAAATLGTVAMIGLDSSRNIYLSDYTNHRVRAVSVGFPPAPVLTGSDPVSPSASTTLRVKGTTLAATTVQLHTDAACASPAVATGTAADLAGAGIEVSVAAQSSVTFYATAVDRLMSVSPCSAGLTYVHDSIAPAAPTLVSGPPAVAAGRAPQWQFSGAGDATWECQLSLTTPVFAYAPCTSPVTYDLTGEADGTYTLSVRGRDAAGNVGPPLSAAYTLDTTAPDAPTITVAPASPGTGRSPTWSFSSVGAQTTECALVAGAGAPVLAPCTSPATFDLTGQPDGTYTFWVRGLDAAQNPSLAATSTYTLDSAAVSAPTITAGPAATDNDPMPTWSFSIPPDAPGGATAECELTAPGGGTTVVPGCGSPAAFDLSAAPDGAYTFRVYLRTSPTDTGAAATAGYLLDTAPPADPVVSALQGATGAGDRPSWSVSSAAGTTALCRLDRDGTPSVAVVAEAPCASPQTYALGAHPDGSYTLTVRALDAAGNPSGDVVSSYVMDRAAPTAPVIAGPATQLVTAPVTSWGFSTPAGSTATQCRLARDGVELVAYATCTTPRELTEIGAWPDGEYAFSVRAVDAAGNVSPVASAAATLDTVAPVVPVLTGSPGDTAGGATATWAFSTEPGTTTTCGLRASALAPSLVACTSPQAYDMTGAPEGDYVFEVRATDPAGNAGPVLAVPFRFDTTAPTAPAFTSQPAATGTELAPVWEFTVAADGVPECQISVNAAVVDPFDSCASPVTIDVPEGSTDEYTLTVRARDGAGNLSALVASSYRLQQVVVAPPPPPAPSATPTQSTTPTPSATPTPSVTPSTTPSPSPTATPPPPVPPSPAPVPMPPDPVPTPPAPPGPPPAPEPTPTPEPEPAPAASPEPAPTVSEGQPASLGGLEEPGPAAVVEPAPRDYLPPLRLPDPDEPMLPPAPVVTLAPAESRPPRRSPASAAPKWIPLPDMAEVVTVVRETTVTAAKNGAFPVSLVALVALFLTVQNRIDRNDPKLALAPIHAEPDLGFGLD